jgi:hypothetical protein
LLFASGLVSAIIGHMRLGRYRDGVFAARLFPSGHWQPVVEHCKPRFCIDWSVSWRRRRWWWWCGCCCCWYWRKCLVLLLQVAGVVLVVLVLARASAAGVWRVVFGADVVVVAVVPPRSFGGCVLYARVRN